MAHYGTSWSGFRDRRSTLKRRLGFRSRKSGHALTGPRSWPADQGQKPSPADAPPRLDQQDRLVLNLRSPFGCFAHWVLAPEDRTRIRETVRSSAGDWRLTLRLCQNSAPAQRSSEFEPLFDQSVSSEAVQRFLPIWRPGRVYCARLGLLRSDRTFVCLLTSNPVSVPDLPVQAAKPLDRAGLEPEKSEGRQPTAALGNGDRAAVA